MSLKKNFLMIWRKERPLIDVWHYIVGNYRYKFYCWQIAFDTTPFKKFLGTNLMRRHIREQIKWRMQVMSTECLENGSCTICGCETPHLQMCKKSCDKPCYPPLMKKEQWESFKRYNAFTTEEGAWMINYRTKQLMHYKK